MGGRVRGRLAGMPIALGSALRIRPYVPDDVDALARNANDPRIAEMLRDGFPHPYTTAHARAFLARNRATFPPRAYAIDDDGEVVGGLGVLPGEDVHRHTAELGYWLAVPYWGRGVMTRAVRRFVPWAMDTFDLVRVFASCFSSNPASSRVLEKAGFRYEGRLRSAVMKRGRILDQHLWATTRRRRRSG